MADDLFGAMVKAYEAQDDWFFRLCEQNAQWIQDNWDEWSRTSPTDSTWSSNDPAGIQRRGDFLLTIAQCLDQIGYRGPMDQLLGITGDSPLVRNAHAMQIAHQHAEAGDHGGCRAALLTAIGHLDGLNGAERLLAGAHVQLALCSARTGDLRSAAHSIRVARELERRAGDLYFSATKLHFDALTTHDDAQISALRRSIAHAQLLSDNGEFLASNAELYPLLRRAGRYLGKVQGLLGLNHHMLGERAKAEEFTELALAECERRSDAAGIAIYTANLAAIRR